MSQEKKYNLDFIPYDKPSRKYDLSMIPDAPQEDRGSFMGWNPAMASEFIRGFSAPGEQVNVGIEKLGREVRPRLILYAQPPVKRGVARISISKISQ